MLKKILTENEINYTMNTGHILQSQGHTCWQMYKALINFFFPQVYFTEKILFYLFICSQVSYA